MPRPAQHDLDYMHACAPELAQKLAEWGHAVERGLGQTGVARHLRRGSGARSTGIRADMDALPIEEKTGLPHASQRSGIMPTQWLEIP